MTKSFLSNIFSTNILFDPEPQGTGRHEASRTGQDMEHLMGGDDDDLWGDREDESFMELATVRYVGICGTRDGPGTEPECGDQSEDDEVWGTKDDKVFMQSATKRYVGVCVRKSTQKEETSKLGDQPKDGGPQSLRGEEVRTSGTVVDDQDGGRTHNLEQDITTNTREDD